MHNRTMRQRRLLVPRAIDPETPALRPLILIAARELRHASTPVSPSTIAAVLTIPVALVEAQYTALVGE